MAVDLLPSKQKHITVISDGALCGCECVCVCGGGGGGGLRATPQSRATMGPTVCPRHHIKSTFTAEDSTPVFYYNDYSTLCLVSSSEGM